MTTTDLGYDDPPNPGDLEARLRGVLAELARIHEGGDSTPVPDSTLRTPAQAWWWLITADPVERMERLASLMNFAEEGLACFTGNHAARIECLQGLLNSRPVTAGGTE